MTSRVMYISKEECVPMPLQLNRLKIRVLSALVIGPTGLLCIYLGGFYFLGMLCVVMGLSLYEWFHLVRQCTHTNRFLIAGAFYLLFCFLCFYVMRAQFHAGPTLLFFVMLGMSDTCAYFFGKFIGGPKMIPSISPKKTWAGLLGAVIGPCITLCAYFAFVFERFQIDYVSLSFVFAVVIGLAGQGGDLLMSYFKRLANVKDTGDLIPGHGGILDRIDSMLLASPVFLLILYITSALA